MTKVPFLEDRLPQFGETADVCVIDLHEETIRTVYETKSWGFQTGALLHWADTDRYLYTNDVFNGKDAVCVEIDLETGKKTRLSGPMYNTAPNGTFVVGFPLELLNFTQQGYGVPSKNPDQPEILPPGAAKNEGVWQTNIQTNEKKLVVSLADVAEKIPKSPPKDAPPYDEGTFYFWHTKVNRQSSRILQVLRCMFPNEWGGRNAMVFTYDINGNDINYTMPKDPVWGLSGGHPNWHPDGIHVIRNLRPEGENSPYRFCQFNYDGSEFKVLSDKIAGGGHPRITPKGRYISTDAFPEIEGRQHVQIRLVDLIAEKEETICTLPTSKRDNLKNSTIRLDGHPAWSRDYKHLAFQAAPEGMRQVFIADLSKLF